MKRILLVACGLFLLALPTLAFAQEAAAVVDEATTLDKLLLTFGSTVVAALGYLGVFVKRLLAEKAKTAWWAGVLMRTTDLALILVREIEATYVENLDANKDGKVDAAEKAKAKGMVVDKLKSYLGMKGLGEIAKVVGLENVDHFLGSVVEHALVTHDNSVAAASGPR